MSELLGSTDHQFSPLPKHRQPRWGMSQPCHLAGDRSGARRRGCSRRAGLVPVPTHPRTGAGGWHWGSHLWGCALTPHGGSPLLGLPAPQRPPRSQSPFALHMQGSAAMATGPARAVRPERRRCARFSLTPAWQSVLHRAHGRAPQSWLPAHPAPRGWRVGGESSLTPPAHTPAAPSPDKTPSTWQTCSQRGKAGTPGG